MPDAEMYYPWLILFVLIEIYISVMKYTEPNHTCLKHVCSVRNFRLPVVPQMQVQPPNPTASFWNEKILKY